ncbi:MAG: outer membrane lipoprotein carrier protein LolA [Paludibacteraceae bacterium]|nr:outer membrane lipoprotein carrier protein LolA [Paludibacteraceae bacterium]
MKKIYFIFLLLCSMSAWAQVQIAPLATASSRFRQTRTSAMLQEPEIRMGSFEFSAPDEIRWIYDGLENLRLPDQMLALIKQAVSGRMEGAEELFQMEWNEQELTMVPRKKQMKRFFSSIRIVFAADGVARQVLLTEPTGDTTTIEFINIKYTITH